MTDAGKRLIEGLKEAIKGDFARVHIDGQTWVRVSPPVETSPDIGQRVLSACWAYDDYDAGVEPRLRGVMSHKHVEAMLRAAFSELFDGSHWLAPWEPDAKMVNASIGASVGERRDGQFEKCSRREKHKRRYAAMRKAYLTHIKSQGGE